MGNLRVADDGVHDNSAFRSKLDRIGVPMGTKTRCSVRDCVLPNSSRQRASGGGGADAKGGRVRWIGIAEKSKPVAIVAPASCVRVSIGATRKQSFAIAAQMTQYAAVKRYSSTPSE